jgi:hypothetical protein
MVGFGRAARGSGGILFFARTYLVQAEGYTHGIHLYKSRSMRRVSLHLCCHVCPILCPYTTCGVAWTMVQRPAVSRGIHVISNYARLENHVGNSHSRKSGSLSSLKYDMQRSLLERLDIIKTFQDRLLLS